jgi:hypothetical protein
VFSEISPFAFLPVALIVLALVTLVGVIWQRRKRREREEVGGAG